MRSPATCPPRPLPDPFRSSGSSAGPAAPASPREPGPSRALVARGRRRPRCLRLVLTAGPVRGVTGPGPRSGGGARLGCLGLGEMLGARPGHVPGPHGSVGRELHGWHGILLSPVSHHRAYSGAVRSPPEPVTEPAPAGTLWRHRDFLLLWAGQSVSEMGSAVTQLALPLTAVVILQASTFQVGLLTSAATVAFAVIALPAGALVDRWAKRRLMIWCDAA